LKKLYSAMLRKLKMPAFGDGATDSGVHGHPEALGIPETSQILRNEINGFHEYKPPT
jgi:hypothetical protein